jgi:hypothetical protein
MSQPQDVMLYAKIKSEIEILEKYQLVIRSYLAGHEYSRLEVLGTLQGFRDTLNAVSGHILTLYELKGQRTKITWEPLLVNLSNALENMRTAVHPNPRAALELALNMSEPNVRAVMKYLAQLKAALK